MNDTDRELLELAARAADIELMAFGGVGQWYQEELEWGYQTKAGDRWNPLTDDGDSLRLAVKLGVVVDPSGLQTGVRWPFGELLALEFHGDDPAAATRRAIVRAAAEIGRTK